MKESKFHSLILLGLLLLFVIVVYNISISPIHNNPVYQKKNINLLVPSYGQNSYVSEKNNLNNLEELLCYYTLLKDKYKMKSNCMKDIY